MNLWFNSYELIVTFDEGAFGGQTVHFFGKRINASHFLAYPLFVHQIEPPSAETLHGPRMHIREIDGDELSAMTQAVTAYCAASPLKIDFEEMHPHPGTNKVRLVSLTYNLGLAVLFYEGEFAGQIIHFSTTPAGSRDLNLDPFSARQFDENGKKIRDVPFHELPAMIQALKELRAASFADEYRDLHVRKQIKMIKANPGLYRPAEEIAEMYGGKTLLFFGE